MAVLTAYITVDPGGRTMLVDIQNMAGVSQTTYDAANNGSQRTLPLSINTVTTFYLTMGGDYQVSAKVNNREIAGDNGTKKAVTVPVAGERRVVPVVDQGEALEAGEIVGSSERGYAEVTTSDTTTNTDANSITSNKIPGLSVTVVGEGLPVLIEFFTAGAYHSVANTGVEAVLVVNGSTTSGQAAIAVSPSTSLGSALLMRRRMVLTAGTSYTFEIGKFLAAAGTGTFLGNPNFPMYLSVNR